MRPSATIAFLAFLCVAPLAAQQDSPTIIRDVTIVDVVTGLLTEHRSVVIDAGRIVTVGAATEVTAPADAEIVDGTGRYLIPGLWDMHTHLLWSTDESEGVWSELPQDEGSWTLWERLYGPTLDLLIANGVTGIREMWGDLDIVRRVHRQAAAGERLAPRMIVAGHLIDGPPALWPGLVIVSTPAEARAAVDSLHALGAEFITVRDRIRPDAYRALVDRASELGLDVVGHVPWLVPATEVSDAGQTSIEHMSGLVEGCSSARDELIDLNGRILVALGAGDRGSADSVEERFFTLMLSTQDEGLCRSLLQRLVANGTWLVPTLVLKRELSGLAQEEEALLMYVHPAFRSGWAPENSPYGEKTETGYAQRLRWRERQAVLARMAAAEGVPILSGTDTPNAYVFPGFGLHDELELLVRAGLTPLQALQTATINPARFLNATDSLGTVEEGKAADLVLLNANPLEDIRRTRRIEAVILRGRLLRREALERLLERVERRFGTDGPGRP